ncbi:LysR family transcriptional regulator [Pseudomonas gingeri]|uniref:LysR family transcriptional regulator n=1 Tax=Pseudomonas gingeri TaxID=117681 RepID=UPI0015A4C92C|nr:LysR family transcriptional regulator [Pseudomonas gingeri]NWD73148.1 LysR family transcriptional regulator [Pseudomonas gingeri]
MKLELPDFSTFIAVAKHRSFRFASEALGVSPSAVSHAIRQIEADLQLRLFSRTTRSVSLTEAGQRLYERLIPAYDDILRTLDELNEFRDTPSGTVRINAVRQGARLYLVRLVAGFSRCYPNVQVEITMDDSIIDIVQGQFDVGVRLGAIVEKDMIAIPIAPPIRYSVVALREYFEGNPLPKAPSDLTAHRCVRFRYPSGRLHYWPFERDGQKAEIAVPVSVTVDDVDLAMDFVMQGMGIGYLPSEQTAAGVKSGVLVSVLEDWLPSQPGFHLYYPSKQYMSSALRAFIDYIKTNGTV